MRHCILFLGLTACIACSSSSNGSSGSSGGDAGADGAGSNTMTCGKGSVTGTLRATDPNGLGPIQGATVSAPGCTTAVTDDRGYVNVATDPTFVVNLAVTAPNYMHEFVAFQALATGFAGQGYLYESNITSKLSGWSSSQGYVFVLVGGNGTMGTCGTGDGVTFSIKSHPEIKATYWSDPLTPDSMLPSTGTLGIGTLGPVPAGTYEIDGTKTGCTIGPAKSADFTFQPTVDVAAGILTVQELTLQ
jgi:hypothetical protein